MPTSRLGLSELVAARRAEILDRWMRRITEQAPAETAECGELREHLPRFLDELLEALRREQGVTSASPLPEASAAAPQHGQQRLRIGFDVRQVMREYAVLGECILDEVEAAGIVLTPGEQRVLFGSLATGAAEAVTAHVHRSDEELRRRTAEHVAFIAHELRNPLTTVRVALQMLRKTALADGGPLVEILERSLTRVRELIDQVLTAERLEAGVELNRRRLSVGDLLTDVGSEAAVDAEQKGVRVVVEEGGAGLALEADPRLLRSALANLLRNGIKFTQPGETVTLRVSRGDGCVVLEVEDRCGGLPRDRETAEALFRPYVQRGADRSGFGLGLAITRQAVDAHGGRIRVRNLPGVGCVFALELPTGAGAAHRGRQERRAS